MCGTLGELNPLSAYSILTLQRLSDPPPPRSVCIRKHKHKSRWSQNQSYPCAARRPQAYHLHLYENECIEGCRLVQASDIVKDSLQSEGLRHPFKDVSSLQTPHNPSWRLGRQLLVKCVPWKYKHPSLIPSTHVSVQGGGDWISGAC